MSKDYNKNLNQQFQLNTNISSSTNSSTNINLDGVKYLADDDNENNETNITLKNNIVVKSLQEVLSDDTLNESLSNVIKNIEEFENNQKSISPANMCKKVKI